MGEDLLSSIIFALMFYNFVLVFVVAIGAVVAYKHRRQIASWFGRRTLVELILIGVFTLTCLKGEVHGLCFAVASAIVLLTVSLQKTLERKLKKEGGR